MWVFIRRLVTIGFWPIIDLCVTVFANIMLVKFGVVRATIGTALLNVSLNTGFLYLLHLERQIPAWAAAQARNITLLRPQNLNIEWWRDFAVLAAYAISGPAMVGVPGIWLLGIRGRRAYLLATTGAVLNTALWVGGVYNLFWQLVRLAVTKI